ncbi:mCG50443 [Mus musculus]|nr:mCG50443 [Mus musculus]
MPEAVHLGDLLRIWVRPGDLQALPRIFKGQRELTGCRRNHDAFQGTCPSLRANPFQGALPFTKKRELSPGLLRDRSRYRTGRLAAPISATLDLGI